MTETKKEQKKPSRQAKQKETIKRLKTKVNGGGDL